MDKVEFVDVRKGEVFQGFSFGAPAGQITALVGPPGSGKTTAIRMVAGLDRPDKGVVLITGVDVGAARGSRLRRIRRTMSVMLQSDTQALFEKATVRENVTYGMRAAGHVARKHVDRIAQDYLERFALTGVSEEKPAALTFGERKRLAVCRTLALRSPLVVIDDLDGDLQPFEWAALCDMVRDECSARRATCLIATRNPAVADRVANRVVELGVPADEVGDVREHVV